ncbi:diguanylate cyclase/phosphodiesterase domain 1 [Salinisphaera sp. S4-8]|uniref:GGDEF domain-containing protein n=1 Tax=Salinisphaera sp. S4-8 TaxID=633357 RepID=UPI003341DF0E
MPQTQIAAGVQSASLSESWALWLKLVSAGATVALTSVLVVLTLSLYTRRDQYTPSAVHFTLANLATAGYVVSDTSVHLGIALANTGLIEIAYRVALCVLPLALAAYICVYWCLTCAGWPSRRRLGITYGLGLFAMALPWIDSPYMVVANTRLRFSDSNVFLDYGAAAGPFFALCLGVFAYVSYRVLRLAAIQNSAHISLLTGFGLTIFVLCGLLDASRELGHSILPVDTLALSCVLFQTLALAVMVRHYSLTLDERRAHNAQLEHATDRANRDALSGLYNRGFFEEYMKRPGVAARGGLLFVDIDHFKTINDDYGHATGDRLIQQLATCLCEATREHDIVCRWGGDEFVILLELSGDCETAKPAIERLVRALDQASVDGPDGLTLSASMGYAEFDHGQWQEALQRADAALYEAKRGGRKRVRIAG